MCVFEQDALSYKQLLASVVEKLESHNEVSVKMLQMENVNVTSPSAAKVECKEQFQ